VKRVHVIWSNQATAKQIVENILSSANQLESFPECDPRQEKIKNTKREHRFLVKGNYKFIYTFQLEQQLV